MAIQHLQPLISVEASADLSANQFLRSIAIEMLHPVPDHVKPDIVIRVASERAPPS